jgi:hypothetical protein
MTMFPFSKWAIKRIYKIRRNFLWHGSEDPRRRNCQVNWRRILRPKRLGGLRILDLKKFNTALRLRWKWRRWTVPSKPWTCLTVPMSAVEKALFRACTHISVGNGNRTRFWNDRWLRGQRPRDIASLLYRLAWQKNLTVAQALMEGNRSLDCRGFKPVKKYPNSLSYGYCSVNFNSLSEMMRSPGGLLKVATTLQSWRTICSLLVLSWTLTGLGFGALRSRKMSILLLVTYPEQGLDGRSHCKIWWTDKHRMPTLPHPARDGNPYSGFLLIFSVGLDSVGQLDRC